jgi:lysophospholipase L1-like esterase
MRNTLLAACTGALLATSAAAQTSAPTYKFDFGTEKASVGYQAVLPTAVYSDATGYGFDFGTTVTAVDRGGKDALKGDFVTSKQPFYFSVKLPEGNYNVTVTLGDAKGASANFLKAESRRLLLETTATKSGQFLTQTFTVNVKDRRISATEKVSLKARELTKLDWDDRLTLEFAGGTPALAALEITPAPQAVTVFLAGNSTVVDQEDEPWASWGQMIPRFFKSGVAIANHAESGLTLGSFLGGKRLTKVLSVMKPGDYLFIEFGHNDQKDKDENAGAWKSYSERLHLFVQETKKKGGIPVIVTSTSRRRFGTDGKVENTLGDYPAAARKVAEDEKVALIDLNAMTARLYEALGEEDSKKALAHYPANTFPGQTKALADNTHFNTYGAYEIAKCVVEGIRANKLELMKFLRNDTPAFDPAKPDAPAAWNWIASPHSSATKPDGN